MKTTILFSVLIASVAFAQKHHEQVGKLMSPPRGHVKPPHAIEESDREKRCPKGFKEVGKQCVQTVNAPAQVVCPPGSQQLEGKCAKVVGKKQVCPIGFDEENDQCVRKMHAPIEVHCPEGYVFVGNNQCAKKVQGPPHKECPAGSIPKGDHCVKKVTESPKLSCPAEFKLEGKRCILENTFDCTPPKKSKVHPTKGGSGKGGPATVEEFVLHSTCKRITSEPAAKICHEGKLEGKICIVEVEVEALHIPGKFHEVMVPAAEVCPEGFHQAEGNVCVKVEYATPFFVCPPGTTDTGDMCATFVPAKIICPHGFSLENDHVCVKTIFAAPIIEYSVTYTCKGKNCAQQH